MNQHQVGSTVPSTSWKTNCTDIVWVVKWVNKKGLQPVRPHVYWSHDDDFDLSLGKAVCLR